MSKLRHYQWTNKSFLIGVSCKCQASSAQNTHFTIYWKMYEDLQSFLVALSITK